MKKYKLTIMDSELEAFTKAALVLTIDTRLIKKNKSINYYEVETYPEVLFYFGQLVTSFKK